MPDPVITPPASNNPPLVETARMDIEEQLAALKPRREELLAALGRAKCTTAEEAGKCVDLTKQLKALAKKADNIRADVKEPYLEASKGVDAAAKAFANALTDGEQQLRRMLKAFDDAERARELAEQRKRDAEERAERERIAAEQRREAEAARAAGASAPAPLPAALEPNPDIEPARPRREEPKPVAAGDYGATAHRRSQKVITISDPYALPEDILTAPRVIEAITTVVRQILTANPDRAIDGVEVTTESKLTIR